MLTTHDLTPERWDDFERLFGSNGACGGCWCMSWRVAKGERWEDLKGDIARQRMQALVASGQAMGVLAYQGGEPVGWCSYGPRKDYPKLDRAPSLACEDADQVWSLPCFFVKKGHRGQGVAKALLAHALRSLEARGATIAETYPAKPPADGKPLPAAFAWTGPRRLFDEAGFEVAGNPDGGKQRMRRVLGQA